MGRARRSKGVEYAILTDEITKAWSGMNTRQYKNLKGLKKEKLRDNMTTLELVLNMLAEATTTEISKQKAPEGLRENVEVARSGGKVAGDARKASREWINQRLQAIQVRKELTDEWDARGVQKGVEYTILTDEITKAWSGMNTRQYKNLKGLKKENLRDNMTTLELVLNMLAEATTTEISKQKASATFSENLSVARKGGEAAGIARKAVEERTGVPVISSKNAAQLNQVVTSLIESAESFAGDDKKPEK